MTISIVIPFHNEEGSVSPLFARLIPVVMKLPGTVSVICIDDGSRDGTLEKLQALQTQHSCIKIIKLSRNFGKEAALSAGIDIADSDAILLLDGDLQHPPEMIPEFLAKLNEGIDVVYGVRRSRKTDGPIRAALSQLFYGIFTSTGDVAIPANAGDFRILSRRAADALRGLPERRRFMKGLYSWIGFTQLAIPYDVEKRQSGSTKWSFAKLFGYAWSGLISFTAAPLRIWSMIGLVIALLSGGYAGFIILETLLQGRSVPGYATLATAVFFLSGIQLLSIGILGEYIARIFEETKGRPSYLIEEIYE